MKRPLNVILIGPPGAGKSTVCTYLTRHIPITVIATGEYLRAEIKKGSPIGKQIEPLLEQGHFAPDALMDRLMRDWLSAVPSDRGLLLDGYPRSRKQALALVGMLTDLKRRLDLVIALDLSLEEAIHRLGGRRICTDIKVPFTLHIDDVAALHRCWRQGGTLIRRDDDDPKVIAERLEVYAKETCPLIQFYQETGLLYQVDAQGSVETVAERILNLMGSKNPDPATESRSYDATLER